MKIKLKTRKTRRTDWEDERSKKDRKLVLLGVEESALNVTWPVERLRLSECLGFQKFGLFLPLEKEGTFMNTKPVWLRQAGESKLKS